MQPILLDLIESGYFDFARLFIIRGCEINFEMNLETPLSMAARCNDIKFVQFLLERGAKEFLTNPDRPRYPIFQCSNYQNFELLRDKWFDPNVVSVSYTHLTLPTTERV